MAYLKSDWVMGMYMIESSSTIMAKIFLRKKAFKSFKSNKHYIKSKGVPC